MIALFKDTSKVVAGHFKFLSAVHGLQNSAAPEKYTAICSVDWRWITNVMIYSIYRGIIT